MNLRQLAEQDLAVTLEDTDNGFGWPVTLTDPDGTEATLSGQSQDISIMVDPETGVAVSGQTATVTLRLASISGAGLGEPVSAAKCSGDPWRATFTDTNGASASYYVETADPDRIIGFITLRLCKWLP